MQKNAPVLKVTCDGFMMGSRQGGSRQRQSKRAQHSDSCTHGQRATSMSSLRPQPIVP
jgi:hypothetical protein